jgi:type III restriction enzyme
MILKPYQETAVSKLLSRSRDLLTERPGSKIVFKAPTGSGKTIMMAAFLQRLVSDPELFSKPISVIWAAPRKLHTQSKLKLQSFYEDSKALDCSDFFDLQDLAIGRNEVLFLNWESINKSEKNTIIKENERDFYLDNVLENTRQLGHKIILVIDESHHHATSETSKQLIQDMNPDLTIEVSATPGISDPDELVSVSLDQVREQGMIKKSVVLNPDFSNAYSSKKLDSALSQTSDQFVLSEAIKKRDALAEGYKQTGSNVNPLMLIQLPDKKSEVEEQLMSEVIDYLANDHGVTVDNGKLAVYLSESKENLENIAKPDSEVEVMIFKQAIALGWDCPRAQILVLFRDHKSLAFSIQTVGRIMRMPEPDLGHYSNELLNNSFVYTNMADISINEDVSQGYITIHTSKRIPSYKNIELSSVARQRLRERTRLNPTFTRFFIESADQYELSSKIDLDKTDVNIELISDFQASSVDDLTRDTVSGDLEVSIDNEADLQKMFDFFVRNQLSPFHPEVRSIGRVKESIYRYFDMAMGVSYLDNFKLLVKVILNASHSKHIANVIDIAKERYVESVSVRDAKLLRIENWQVPESINYPSTHQPMQTTKSVMVPFFADGKWKSESAFISLLDSSDSVDWWFQNGERDATFFAVPYLEGGEEKPFYVDFIVLFKNGVLGLFDTKSGQTIETAKPKIDGLRAFIASVQKVEGGIVTNTSRDYSGRWVVFNRDSKELNLGDFNNWETLEI